MNPKVSLASQPCCSTRRATRSFSAQKRFLEIRPLRETFQLQQTNKRHYGEKFYVFFYLGTPKTALLMRNFFIDPRNLSISPPNKQSQPFQFPKKSRGGLPILPGSFRLLTYFKTFRSPSKKFPQSFQNLWLLF